MKKPVQNLLSASFADGMNIWMVGGMERMEPAKKAFDALSLLRGCEAHSSVILSQVDADVYRKLGINLTCEPHYQVKKLYHKA